MKPYSHTSRYNTHIFPLPLFYIPRRPASHSRRILQRYKRTLAIVQCANLCILALNSLFSNSYMFPQPERHIYTDSSTTTAIQYRLCASVFYHSRIHILAVSRVSISNTTNCHLDDGRSILVSKLYTYIYSFLSNSTFPPIPSSSPIYTNIHTNSHISHSLHTDVGVDECDIPMVLDSEGVALFYNQQLPVVKLIADRVSLPDNTLNQVDMLSLLPPSDTTLYSTPTQVCINYPIDGPIQNTNTQHKLRKPRAYADHSEYIKLLIRLTSLNMISYTNKPKCENGLFGIPKSDGSIRLIIDAKPANTRFIQPPKIELPTPTHIAHLVNNSNSPLYISKTDLSNFYHCIRLPTWIQPFFCLPPIYTNQLPIHIQSHIAQHIDIHTNTIIYPMCQTLPMGWSHSVYIAQHIHENILYSVNALRHQDNILHIRSPYISMRSIYHWLYIDDAGLISPDKSLIQSVHTHIQEAYKQAGLVVNMKKVVEPTQGDIDILGITMNGADGSMKVSPNICLTLIRDTLRLIERGVATGIELSRLISSWTWSILTRRPTLAILQHVYRFILKADKTTFILWPSVKRELYMLICITPLLSASLFKRFHSRVVAVDASMTGGAVVSAKMNDISNDFSNLWQCGYKLSYDILTTENNTKQYKLRTAPFDSSPYRTIATYKWLYEQHINELEMRTMLTAIKWCISYPSAMGKRVLLLTDSQVCYYSVRKGRSSSPRLLLLLRKIAALCLASGIVLHIVWVDSSSNPADLPSRIYSL